ncbi:MAG: methylenetetrahydrofolate reductase [Paracoccus sp. (in: a-proteobacteria)]|uniref:methylenetetrahydrofolate reductase n=1 Tax=Paracoccus sp. TaxID=267 RepID=UPI0026DF8086|nr:methylenetetrahydrofolate reductase [Paracoccus sp. (in: a-proteobacteria)]MDO5631552.1 methylenetetrahydrofolate reductase [Paracoccus sp. (in: a-proteobacteria)]
MSLMPFRVTSRADVPLADFLQGASIEVMPRTAAGVADFRAILPAGTQVFVAHIDGTAPADMQATVARLAAEGMAPVPHIPARIVPDRPALADWVAAYRDAGADQVLLLGGGLGAPRGAFADSMQLLDTGLFGDFKTLFVAGHPEGNRDIDPAGGEAEVMRALRWKADFAERTGADMQIVTQFCFEAQPVIDWAARLQAAGLNMPIRIGVAGPAKLQTMLKFAIMCGVGPSLRVLQRRARDVTKLLTPYEPTDFVTALARHKAANPDFPVIAAHIFPLGGITASTDWLARASAD